MSDNWSLQDISSLLTQGLDSDTTAEIVLEDGKHFYNPISHACVQTEALFDFITDLMLCDEVLVDEKFISSWERFNSPLAVAKEKGILCPYPFLEKSEKIEDVREKIVSYLCSTKSLKEAHQKNVDGWEENQQTPDPYLSATLWGGAGMCARSSIFGKAYTPHPLRKKLFVNSGFMLPVEDSRHQLKTFLNDERVRVTEKIYGQDSLFSSYINIPAIPLRVIQDSDSPDKIISTALEMRDDFKSLRNWLELFQEAINHGDLKKLLKYRKELDSISNHVDKKIGYGSNKEPLTMEAGISIFKIPIKVNPIENIKNRIGVQATLNKLIFSNSGRSEIQKFLKMFGENKTKIGYEIEQTFLQHQRKT